VDNGLQIFNENRRKINMIINTNREENILIIKKAFCFKKAFNLALICF